MSETMDESKSLKNKRNSLRRGPSFLVHKEPKKKPSLVPSLFVLSAFFVTYMRLQKTGRIQVPTHDFYLDMYPMTTGIMTAVGVANMFNHVAGYLQPVPMWSLFTGAFIDFNSSAIYMLFFYCIGYTPSWLVACWIFQMGIHSYYMSTGLSKPEDKAQAFASLMAHMRKLQTNTKEWWNTLFLYFDMIFHAIFLLEVLPHTTNCMLAVDVFLSYILYSFLYNRNAGMDDTGRPVLFVDAKTLELRCPCKTCNGSKPFALGCAQWYASIDQLYLDCWGVYEGGEKQTSTLMERAMAEDIGKGHRSVYVW